MQYVSCAQNENVLDIVPHHLQSYISTQQYDVIVLVVKGLTDRAESLSCRDEIDMVFEKRSQYFND